jgi:hypothetical protein
MLFTYWVAESISNSVIWNVEFIVFSYIPLQIASLQSRGMTLSAGVLINMRIQENCMHAWL